MRANDDELRASIGETYRANILWFDSQESKTALQILIRQCCLAPSCGGQVPYCRENPGPCEDVEGELDSSPELENRIKDGDSF
jgi:hypothetical protein